MRMENTRTVITMKWKDWVHVTKLDPDKQLKPGDIDAIAASGTDALMLSGTLNVTAGEPCHAPEAAEKL